MTKLCIRNLDALTDSARLDEMFGAVGEVRNVNIQIKNINGQNYTMGYVEMATPQEALDGIDRFNGQKYNGATLVVTMDRPHIPLLPVKPLKTASKGRSRTAKA